MKPTYTTATGLHVHQPKALYARRRKNPPRLIGYGCECGALYTASMTPSSVAFERKGRVIENRAHVRRRRAMKWWRRPAE